MSENKSDWAKREEEVLSLWKDKNIFNKSLEQTRKGKTFTFYDGPPFATGLPHYGHLLAGTMKDVIPRYQTMLGKYVERIWGWDCHGLPIENLIQKELNVATKADIEKLGISNFNEAARNSVLRYDREWREVVDRTGRFIDMENSYKTMNSTFMESVWWSFKELQKKGYVYESFKSMHISPKLETPLSNFEVGLNYKDIDDLSVYVKFELSDEPGTYLIAWTTTPWTLPGNVALAINPSFTYLKIRIEGKDGLYIVAKERIESLISILGQYEIVEEIKELIGKSYKPLFNEYVQSLSLENKENGWKVYPAEFVTNESGTGIVHVAPAFGEDDLNLGQKEKLPFIQHVKINGEIKEELGEPFAGKQAKPANDPTETDVLFIKWLSHNNSLFAKEKYRHSYPFCWRSDVPLLNYAMSSWFVDVPKIKDKLIKNNNSVSWVPERIGIGRFGKWLEGAREWAVSRNRYWGTPIPIWKSEDGVEVEFIGSVEELKSKLPARNKYFAIRHGQAESNIGHVISSIPENGDPLTETGRKQVKESAQKILKKRNIDIIYTSNFSRTRQTAEIIAEELGIAKENVIVDERIGEARINKYEGKRWDDFYDLFDDKSKLFHSKEGGESFADVYIRTNEFMFDVDKKHEGKNILIVSHGSPLSMIFAASEGLSIDNFSKLYWDNDKPDIKNAEVKDINFWNYPHNPKYELDLHRPYIDDVVWINSKGKKMIRIKDVFDTWYDSGSMPFSKLHYPFENEKVFKKSFPADFIAEGQDQTRGWFYTLLVLNTILFGVSPYKNVIVNGLVLAEDGQKMSKSKKNFPDPMLVIDKYGADAVRFYLMNSPVVRAEDLCFSEKGVDEVFKKVIGRTRNVVSFYEMYSLEGESIEAKDNSDNVLDKWVIAKFKSVFEEVTNNLNSFELDKASRPLADFIDDLSTWYVRRSRDRFKGDNKDVLCAKQTLKWILIQYSKIIAPFMPFLADDIYLRMDASKESVHLESWPRLKSLSGGEKKLIEEMILVREVVSLALEARAKANIKTRQPLAGLCINKDIKPELLLVIAEEVNVKKVDVDVNQSESVVLNTNISQELKEEGLYREITRAGQDARKKLGLKPIDSVLVSVVVDKKEGEGFIDKYKDQIIVALKAQFVSEISDENKVVSSVEFDGMQYTIIVCPVR